MARAHPRAEPVVPGKVAEPVQAGTIGIAFGQHRLHNAREDRVRHAAEGVEGQLLGLDQPI